MRDPVASTVHHHGGRGRPPIGSDNKSQPQGKRAPAQYINHADVVGLVKFRELGQTTGNEDTSTVHH